MVEVCLNFSGGCLRYVDIIFISSNVCYLPNKTTDALHVYEIVKFFLKFENNGPIKL